MPQQKRLRVFELLWRQPEVLVQGITGTHGSFHTEAMQHAGTRIVAGVTPGKAGQQRHGVPVYDAVAAAIAKHPSIGVSVIFVPAPFAKSAMLEALEAGIRFIVCITEGVPVYDMLAVRQLADRLKATIIGPNCPGILLPGGLSLGIIPNAVGTPGDIAIVSRSGTLTYEAAASLTSEDKGQRIVVGIGGDQLPGTNFVDCLRAFEADKSVTRIILIGEIGGQAEQQAAQYIREHITKPVYAYVVGHSAPEQIQLGHAGAIMGTAQESAAAKTEALKKAGVIVAMSMPELITLVV